MQAKTSATRQFSSTVKVSALARATKAPIHEVRGQLEEAINIGTQQEPHFVAPHLHGEFLLHKDGQTGADLGQGRERKPRDASTPKVVIVGAGISGLGCAFKLWSEHGIAAQVFEANTTTAGGRIRTLRGYFDDDQYTELHAELISSEHREARHLADLLDLELDDVLRFPPGSSTPVSHFHFGDRTYTQAQLDEEWHEWAWELFHQAAFEVAPWPTTYAATNPEVIALDHMSATQWMEQHLNGGVSTNFASLCTTLLYDEYGGPIDEQSALNLIYLLGHDATSEDTSQPQNSPELTGTDEHWHISGGNDQLISQTIAKLPAGTVQMGHCLEALRRRGVDGWTCVFRHDGTLVEVDADHVVLAIPFPKLRQVDLSDVPIPAAQRRAIDEEPLGSNSKLQVQFSSRVWNAQGWTANYYSDDIAQGGWETTVNQPGPSGILIALPGGESATSWGERYGLTTHQGEAPEHMVREFLECFESYWPGTRDAYCGKAYYAWGAADPNILGSYSYLKPGQYTAFNGLQGNKVGTVHFAGEHTSMDYQGFVEGALRSGYRCALEIIRDR
jgi:monoamine oxidase